MNTSGSIDFFLLIKIILSINNCSSTDSACTVAVSYTHLDVYKRQEEYWGNVNPIGPRGVYDEAKRFQEAITMAYHNFHGLETRIVRIFNTYGPRMRVQDGRALPAFFSQAIRGEDITVFGDGSQTRSFCYVDDLIEGIYRLL